MGINQKNASKKQESEQSETKHETYESVFVVDLADIILKEPNHYISCTQWHNRRNKSGEGKKHPGQSKGFGIETEGLKVHIDKANGYTTVNNQCIGKTLSLNYSHFGIGLRRYLQSC